MDPEIEKGIDLILKECYQNGQVRINTNTPEAILTAIPRAKTLEVIQPKGANSYELTNKGLQAINLGGISQYLKDLDSKANIDEKIKDLTRKQLKGSIFQLRYWWLPLIISGVIGFITGNFEIILKWFKYVISFVCKEG